MLPRDHPLLAVVSPPNVDRFFELTGVDPEEEMTADFVGWCKLALLTHDRVFLFPRSESLNEAMEREVEGLRVFGAAGLPEIPALLGVWRDVGLGPGALVAIRRLPGIALEAHLPGLDLGVLGDLAERLGELAARWHAVDPGPLVGRPTRTMERRGGLQTLLGSSRSVDAATSEVAACLSLDAAATARARDAIERARRLANVPIHGDVHEAQLLVDPNAGFRLTGVIDWQTSAVDHPFSEFDLCEWGPTVWREHRADFPTLRARFWRAYAPARGLESDLGPVFEWVYATSLAMQLASGKQPGFDTTVVGTLDEARAAARDATAKLPAVGRGSPGPTG